MALTITQQDRQLLELISTGESGGNYNIVNGVGTVPQLTSMTLQQVIDYSKQVAQGSSSGAVGKYQFIPSTLEGIVNQSGISRTTIFSPDIQDYLIIETIKGRGLESWKSGSLTDDKFMINLAKEFASIPVPYSVFRPESRQWPARQLAKGESYYAGVQGNRATHDPDAFLQSLADIRSGGPGATITLSEQAAASPAGNLPMTQAEILAGGGQRIRGGQGPVYNSTLPAATDPYLYVPNAAENNRYDFRTGKKVRDLLVNGVNPLYNRGLTAPVASSTGVDSYTPEQVAAITENRVSVGYGTGQVDQALAQAAGLVPSAGTTLPTPNNNIQNTTPTPTTGPRSLPTAIDV